jgi:predicted RecB family endonuclease
MKASDIIQGLAELIAVIQRDEQQSKFQEPTTVAQPEIVAVVEPTAPQGELDSDKFVPPLQAKIELLKKATGVPSTYDSAGEPDELDRMKQMAGIQQPHPVVADEAASDEPLDV